MFPPEVLSNLRPFLWSRAVALYTFAATLLLIAAVLATVAIQMGLGIGTPAAVAALSLLALVAERQSVRLSSATELSVSSLPVVFAAVMFGPLAAMIVGGISLLGILGRPYIRWIVWTSLRAVVGGVAGFVAVATGGPDAQTFLTLVLAVAAVSVADIVTDYLLNAAILVVRGSGSVREFTRGTMPVLFASAALHTPVIALLAYAYREVSPLSVALFLVPAFAAQWLFLLYRQQRDSAAQLLAVNERLERASLSFASALVATLDARDRYTAGHSAAVAVYARDIAARIGLREDEQQLVHVCGLVHDIGKIGLPAGLLEKPGPLTLEERRHMERHSEIGERILDNVEDYAEIAKVVRHHHERVDGEGYPDRLSGEQIPLLSKIIAVADAYNAMTSDRPYRDAMPSRVARLRLAQAVESQFDTTIVAAFEAILAGANETYRTGAHADFAVEARDVYTSPSSAVA